MGSRWCVLLLLAACAHITNSLIIIPVFYAHVKKFLTFRRPAAQLFAQFLYAVLILLVRILRIALLTFVNVSRAQLLADVPQGIQLRGQPDICVLKQL